MSLVRLILAPLAVALALGSCASTSPEAIEARELRAIAATAGPPPSLDVVAIVYKDGTALYVEPLPPQSLICLKPPGVVGCPVSRVYYGFANVTAQQQADAEWLYRSADLDRNWVLVVGHLATVTVRDHRDGTTSQQTWFMVAKLYMTPYRGRVIELHSTQFFYATGTTSNAQVVAISGGEQSPRAAYVFWTGLAASGSGGPTAVDDVYLAGQADLTRSPLAVIADEYFVRQTR
jgi:hypothetical protein